MRKRIPAIMMMMIFMLSGCGDKQKDEGKTLLGVSWFSSAEDVRNTLTDLSFISERRSENDGTEQLYIDYSDAELLSVNCEVTLDFTDDGLIGLNYHDINKKRNYRQWNEILQSEYGIPSENGNGMASWYQDPAGKNTALYLFNLQEGVQISFYSTSNTPDKSYSQKKREEKAYVPVPELRTPIVPDIDQDQQNRSESPVQTEISTAVNDDKQNNSMNESHDRTDHIREHHEGTSSVQGNSSAETQAPEAAEEPSVQTVPAETGSPAVSEIPVPVTAAVTSAAVPAVTVPDETEVLDVKNQDTYKQKKLEFYLTPEYTKRMLSDYNLSDEYMIEEPGEPWEKVFEYTGVNYFDRYCDVVLCFTSLGLVGINYFDENSGSFSYWTEKLSGIYGRPSELQGNFAVWNRSPLGKNSMIYIFADESGVQISFYADDTGSEISK